MKNYLILTMAVFFSLHALHNSNAQDITLDEFTQICETEFISCYNDTPEGRMIAEDAIEITRMVPLNTIESICNDFCNSLVPDNMRNITECTDQQCTSLCIAQSGRDDPENMQLIDEMDYSALNEICTINCSVTIEKSATFDNGTEFNFSAPGTNDSSFSLFNGESIELEIDFPTSSDITETLPDGWMLDTVECSGAQNLTITEIPNGRNFACGPAGSAQCVFINSPLPRSIPTLSEWGLIAMAGVLGIAVFIAIRKKYAAA